MLLLFYLHGPLINLLKHMDQYRNAVCYDYKVVPKARLTFYKSLIHLKDSSVFAVRLCEPRSSSLIKIHISEVEQ